MENSPFKGLRAKTLEFDVGTDKIKVRPTVADAEAFIIMKKDMTAEDAKRVSKIMVNMIARANSEEAVEDIEAFVALHYGEIIMQVATAFGFATKEQVANVKKNLTEKV